MPRGAPYKRINQKYLDFIDDYLANNALRDFLTPEIIDDYRDGYKHRLRKKYLHPHGNNPFCKICDLELQPGDDVYLFQVNGFVIYHVVCFDKTWWRKKLSIIYQDRAFWKKNPIEEIKKESETGVTEFYKPLREESWRLYEELRKEQKNDVEQ